MLIVITRQFVLLLLLLLYSEGKSSPLHLILLSYHKMPYSAILFKCACFVCVPFIAIVILFAWCPFSLIGHLNFESARS
jgi:hypothetical protein